jgi:hypothetical protein
MLLISLSRQEEVGLTEDQVEILQENVAKFRTADIDCRSVIVQNCLVSIQATWQPTDTFNKNQVEMVCAFSITLGLSLIPF